MLIEGLKKISEIKVFPPMGGFFFVIDIEGLTAEDIALKSMKIAASKCIYTNDNFVMEKVKWD